MSKELPLPQPDKLRIPTLKNKISRHIITSIYKILAPAQVEEYEDSIRRTIDLMDYGYGLLVLGLHYSKSDGLDFVIRPEDIIRQIYGLPVVIPVAYHQYVENKNLLDFLGKISAANIISVVNSDTVERGLNKIPGTDELLPLGYGFPVYVHMINEVIDKHGLAGIAAQAGRRKSLEIVQAKQRTLETLLYAVVRERKKEERDVRSDSPKKSIEQMIRELKIVIMLMPIRPMYKADYEKLYNKYGFFKKKHIQMGPAFTIDELYQVRDEANILLKKRWEEAKASYELRRQKEADLEDPTLRMKDDVTLDEVVITLLSFGADPEYNRIDGKEDFAQAVVDAVDLIEGIRDLV